MNELSPQSYKGTRDFYPSDQRVQNYIFSVWRKVSERYGYEEYSAPLLEPLELYAAKSGQELVSEQTYSFVDRGGRTVTIRPEMTPSVSRMVAAKRQEIALPARLYSIANFMRYERPQKGRDREFWQLNVDIFGSDGIQPEAEMIAMAEGIMQEFGARSEDFIIKVNNRKLINFMMAQYFELDGAKATALIKLFDRKNKLTESEFKDQSKEIFDEQFNEKIEKLENIIKARSMADLPQEIRESSAVGEIQALFTLLERMGVQNATFDITLMRGFDYYTGMVFEVFDTNPENTRSLFGGGRYDGLVGLFGVDPISAVGFAPGATTTEDFLRTHDLLPEFVSTTNAYVITLGDFGRESGQLCADLRLAGLNIEQDLTNRKLEKQIKSAVKKQIPYLIFVGEQEVMSGNYTLKNTATEEEQKLNITAIIDLLKGNK